MPRIIDIVSCLASLASLGTLTVAILAVRAASKQLRQMEIDRVAELRPYVSARYILIKGKSDAAKLRLHNSGRTSARNIKIEFPQDRAWHYLRQPKFSFTTNGLSVLSPGESIEFFMGKLVEGTDFNLLRELPLGVSISYDSGISAMNFSDVFEVNLGDHSYAMPGSQYMA